MGCSKIKVVIGLFVAIMVLAILGVLGWVVYYIVKSSSDNCDSGSFKDITPTSQNKDGDQFFMKDKLISAFNAMEIRDKNGDILGEFRQKFNAIKESYVVEIYDKEKDKHKIVATIKSKILTIGAQYEMDRCDDSQSYKIEQNVLTIGKEEFKIYKNGKKIGQSTKKTFWQFKPEISIEDDDGNPLAYAGRDLITFPYKDRWEIMNFNQDKIDNWVIGFLAYITTWREHNNSNNNHYDSTNRITNKNK